MASPQISKESKMSIKNLVGKKISKKVKFMGEEIEISKLSVAEVMEIQEKAKALQENEAEGFNVLKAVIRAAVADAGDLSDEDFEKFPMEELSSLSDAIMKFSGLGKDSGK